MCVASCVGWRAMYSSSHEPTAYSGDDVKTTGYRILIVYRPPYARRIAYFQSRWEARGATVSTFSKRGNTSRRLQPGVNMFPEDVKTRSPAYFVAWRTRQAPRGRGFVREYAM